MKGSIHSTNSPHKRAPHSVGRTIFTAASQTRFQTSLRRAGVRTTCNVDAFAIGIPEQRGQIGGVR